MNSDLRATYKKRLGFGCGRLKGGSEYKNSRALLSACLDFGIRHFDIAPSYGNGDAEFVLGSALSRSGLISEITVATKVGIPKPTTSVVSRRVRDMLRPVFRSIPTLSKIRPRVSKNGLVKTNFEPEFISASIENSFSCLKLDRIDCLMLHEAPQSIDRYMLEDILLPYVSSGRVGRLGSSTDNGRESLFQFGSASQHRISIFENYGKQNEWEGRHGVFRYIAPLLSQVLVQRRDLSDQLGDMLQNGCTATSAGAAAIAYSLHACDANILFSTDSTRRLKSTLNEVDTLLMNQQWEDFCVEIKNHITSLIDEKS